MKLTKTVFAAAALTAMFSMLMGAATAQSTDGPTQRVIVKFKEANGIDPLIARTLALADLVVRTGVPLRALRTLTDGNEVIQLERRLERAELDALIATFRADPAVERIVEDILLQAMFVPNDPQYNQQWHYFDTVGGLNLPSAWDLSTGAGVRIAVLDTGVRPHADLAANLLGGFDFISDVFIANDGTGRDTDATDPGNFSAAGACFPGSVPTDSSWHGTHVSGTLGAVTNNGSGIAGVAFGAKIVPVRVLGRCGGSLSDVIDAIVWASGGAVPNVAANLHPARVINLSIGAEIACPAVVQSAIDSARSRGTVVVVAAGNANSNASGFAPANCAGVVAVGATNRSGGKAHYSNFGAELDVSAPGGDVSASAAAGVLSTVNTGTTVPASDALAFYEGTSMATPHVAGTAALLLARNRSLTPDDVERVLKTTARPFPGACSGCGTGIVNASAAVRAAGGVLANAGLDRFFSPHLVGMVSACGSTGNIVSYTFEQVSYQSLLHPNAISSVRFPIAFLPSLLTTHVQTLSTPYTTSKCQILVTGRETGDVLSIRVTVRDAAGNSSSDVVALRGAVLLSPEFLAVTAEILANAGLF
jgi:serine protease